MVQGSLITSRIARDVFMTEQLSPKPVISTDTLQRILEFRDERNWKQFHNPKDLAISLSLEAAELLECFQWSGKDTEVAGKTAAMKEELSDVVIYALLLADRLGVDIDTAVRERFKSTPLSTQSKKVTEIPPNTTNSSKSPVRHDHRLSEQPGPLLPEQSSDPRSSHGTRQL